MWFLDKMVNIINMEKRLLSQPLTPDFLREAKKLGFSDEMIGTLADRLPEQVREMRQEWKIRPVYKMVDTCAAEFDAATPYFYSTYETENEAIAVDQEKSRGHRLGANPHRAGNRI